MSAEAVKSKKISIELNQHQKQRIKNKTSKILYSVFRAVLLIGISYVLIYPLIYMISVAFRPMAQAYDPTVIWIPKSLTLDNFKEAIRLMDYVSALFTSIQVNLVSSLLQVVVCALTGYGFARFNFKFKGLFFVLVLVTIVVPPQIIINPTFITFKQFGLLNTPFSFYIPALLGAGIKSGLFVFIYRQFFYGMPKELEDAAAIDGCGFLGCFIRIIIPNALAVSLTAVILSLVWYWNDYFFGSMYMMNHRTVTLSLVNLQSAAYGETIINDPFRTITLMQAGSLLTILPVLLVYIFLQKYFIQGIERSGIVG